MWAIQTFSSSLIGTLITATIASHFVPQNLPIRSFIKILGPAKGDAGSWGLVLT
jgi:hypothetical protein